MTFGRYLVYVTFNDGTEDVLEYDGPNRGAVEDMVRTDFGDVQIDYITEDNEYPEDDPMDGDAASALASAGWGTDEDYGYYGDDF